MIYCARASKDGAFYVVGNPIHEVIRHYDDSIRRSEAPSASA